MHKIIKNVMTGKHVFYILRGIWSLYRQIISATTLLKLSEPVHKQMIKPVFQ